MKKEKLSEILRVNHAGEFGARVIYDGQLAALRLKKDEETAKLVEEMKAQEDVHYEYFDEKIVEKKVRPTVMQPFWRIGGFAMGFLTAALDKRAAMCCTTAVEEVIDEHYQGQLDEIAREKTFLDGEEKQEIEEIEEKIEKFRQDELEHRDIGYENDADKLPYFRTLSALVKAATKGAIFVSKKI